MRHTARAPHGRRACAIIWLTAALFAATQRRTDTPVERAPLLPPRLEAASAAADARPFRLGTAGRPFEWSTAIGDLNADGRPDYAVADRVGRRASGFAYALELSITGVGSRTVSFDSPQEALAVTLRDVDHDHDLDVVVTALVSHVVVGVWLNDGGGRFHEAASLAAFSESQSSASRAGATDDRNTDAAADVTPRRLGDGLSASAAARVTLARLDRLKAADRVAARLLRSPHLRSRAPPAAAISVLT